jgi:protein ImuB
MFACIHGPDAGIIDHSRRNGSSRQFPLTEGGRLDLRRVADSFSPFVEMVDERTAVFSVTSRQLGRLKGMQAAVAATAEAAILAARNLPGYTFISPGEEARVLGALSIDALPPDPELFETFALWGIRSLEDLARLPDDALASRLGARGLWLQRLARGAFERPLRPLLPAEVYEESADLEHPIKLREPLLFLIARFLHDLTARLKSQSLAVAALNLTLNGNQRTHSVPFPTRDVKLLLKLVEHSLERQPPEAPVSKIRLELIPTEPRRIQHGLFTPAAPEPEKLELTLGKIRGLVGEKNVGYPELFDTHRPGLARPARPATGRSYFAFRYFRPPLEARVTAEHLWTRMFQGKILQIAGPWRSSGDWWKPDQWNRDEYDLALSDGALYRIFLNRDLDRAPKKWFVEGVYD